MVHTINSDSNGRQGDSVVAGGAGDSLPKGTRFDPQGRQPNLQAVPEKEHL